MFYQEKILKASILKKKKKKKENREYRGCGQKYTNQKSHLKVYQKIAIVTSEGNCENSTLRI